MAQTAVSLTKGAGSRHRLRMALNTIQSNFTDLYTRVEAVEGGGGVPEWVPENAKAFINLAATNRGAWTEDDGEIALATVLGEQANIESGVGAETSYNSGGLVADGLINNGAVAFLGRIKDYLLEGSTVVVKTKDNGSGSITNFGLMSATGNTGTFFGSNQGGDGNAKINDYAVYDLFAPGTPWDFSGEGSENAIAMTLVPTRSDLSVNNSVVVSENVTTASWPTSGGDVFVGAWYGNFTADEILVSVAIYDPLPSTDGLQALANF
jgi:hypothetical protein